MFHHRARTFLTSLLGLSFLLGNLLTLSFLEAQLAGVKNPSSPLHSQSANTIISEPSSLTSDQAITAALNTIESVPGGFSLHNPRHQAVFTSTGVEFSPTNSPLSWTWQLSAVTAGDQPIAGALLGAVSPLHDSHLSVSFPRGALVEQYLARQDTLEQQFIIPQALPLNGADLVIFGEVHSQGRLEAAEDGWLWRFGDRAVHLGRVRAFDAAGNDLPASMQVTADQTRITVDGIALASAVYPVTIDPEIGNNDNRLSYMGKDIFYDAQDPAVAFNPYTDEYLVVWEADDDENGHADNEYEIYAQLVDADHGDLVGKVIPISNMGENGEGNLDAYNPDVVFNKTDNVYLIVWEADDTTGGFLADDEFEIYVQLLLANGIETGSDDYRISSMGENGNADFDAIRPAVAHNSALDQYLVVWQGDDATDDEFEIYGQLITWDLSGTGDNDFRISDMGPDSNANYDAASPAVTYNDHISEYLVVWTGSDDTGSMALGEREIFGQLLYAWGEETETNDFRISDMGGSGTTTYNADSPDVTFNSTDWQYLVVWYGDDDTGDLVNEEYEIYGQLLLQNGSGEGDNDFRISDMGPDGSISYRAEYPAVTWNSLDNQYLVVWQGVDDTSPLVAGEQEIFSQVMSATGDETGFFNDFRLSNMGPNGNNPYQAFHPAVAYRKLAYSTTLEFLVTWYGDDDNMPLIDNEYEIFSQQLPASGLVPGLSNHRISFMDPVGDPAYDASDPAIGAINNNGVALKVWSGDTNQSSLVDSEYEIWGSYSEISEFRISFMGVDGSAARGAFEPALAFNSEDNQYLVVWRGDDEVTDNEYEIYGQLVDNEGTLIGANFRISDMGPDAVTAYGAYNPDVAYNPTDNQYIVVWSGDDDTGALIDNEFEIYIQLLEADGSAAGANDYRISDMGGIGDAAYDALEPAVAYNDDLNQYMVVWSGDDNTGGLVNDEGEIYGQRLNADGGGEGSNDFRMSSMGGDGNSSYGAFSPDVVYADAEDEYLVVWYGDDNIAPLVDGEYEIFGQRLTPTAGGAGANDFRISDMGPDGSISYDAYNPAVAYHESKHVYLVVWCGEDGAPLADEEYEIYGQLLYGNGANANLNDERYSDMGPDGNPSYGAFSPAVIPSQQLFRVIWEGDDDTFPLVDNEKEIFGQYITTDNKLYLPVIKR